MAAHVAMNPGQTQFLAAAGGRLAYRRVEGRGPAWVWLPGFGSDMTGTKAAFLADAARASGRAFVRFDYSGHGDSDGAFEEGTIGRWRADALAVIDALTQGPLVLVGSSMGGWISLLCALARPERVKGLVLVAPAADFTSRLMEPALGPAARASLAATGRWERPSAYGDGPTVITRRLLEEGRDWLLLDRPIAFDGPVRILHGQDDAEAPWTLGLEIAGALTSRDVTLTLVKGGDHRLSAPADLARLSAAASEVAAIVGADAPGR